MDENWVELDIDFLRESCYWITLKFMEDDFHQQQVSSRRDLIGGFFDRWINKTHELIIFEKLLKEYSAEKYSVVNDYFFYGQGTKKDAPDIIGLKDENDNIYPFAFFNDGSWKLNDECPHVEVKTFRSNQYLVTIPENQYDDNHYYVIMNSHIRPDYLISLFADEFFNKDYFDNIVVNSDDVFIENDSNEKIIKPVELEKNNNLGGYELLGIFKGNEIKKFSKFLEEGIKPWYLMNVSESPKWNSIGAVEEPYELSEGFHSFHENDIDIEFYIEVIADSKAIVKKIIKEAIDIEVEGEIRINGESYENGMFRLNFKEFNRTGNKNEYVSSKNTLKCCGLSSQEELINEMDNYFRLHEIT